MFQNLDETPESRTKDDGDSRLSEEKCETHPRRQKDGPCDPGVFGGGSMVGGA